MKNALNNKRVLFIGDSRKMKGGVSTVMQTLERSSLWSRWRCSWLETQVNASKAMKVLYLVKAFLMGLFLIPRYEIVHFQTTPGPGMLTLLPFFVYTLLWRRRIIVQLHMGNQIIGYVNDWTFKFWARHSDCFIFLGKTWEKAIKPYLPGELRTEYLYNPVSIHEGKATQGSYFLYAAFFNENKGCDVFLKAFAAIADEYPGYRVVMCGSGGEDYMSKVLEDKAISALVEQGRIVFPGWIEGERMSEYYQNAFCYCMTSYQEGLPMSVLESMSHGVPVVSTPVGCLPEILTDRESVLFFDFGDVEQLSYRMRELIESENLRREIASKAHAIVEEKCSVETVTTKLGEIYKTIITNP